MKNLAITIVVPDISYAEAIKRVDGVLAGLDMKRETQFLLVGAMHRLAEAAKIAEAHETPAEPLNTELDSTGETGDG